MSVGEVFQRLGIIMAVVILGGMTLLSTIGIFISASFKKEEFVIAEVIFFICCAVFSGIAFAGVILNMIH